MHQSTLLALAGLLASPVVAVPEFLQARDCSRNNCLRAVVNSAREGGNARGSADCSSLMVRTVSPCPATTTVTSTHTITADPVYQTSYSTSVAVATATVTACGSPPALKVRDAVDDIDPAQLNNVLNGVAATAARAVAARDTVVCPSTATPTAIPAYASSCKSLDAYVSACSCNGIAVTTTALPQTTDTATAWETETLTPTSATTVGVETTSTTTVTSYAAGTPVGQWFYAQDGLNGIRWSAGSPNSVVTEQAGVGAPLVLDSCGNVRSRVLEGFYLVSPGTGDDTINFSFSTVANKIVCQIGDPNTPSGPVTCKSGNGVNTVFNICPGSGNIRFSSAPIAGCRVATFFATQSLP